MGRLSRIILMNLRGQDGFKRADYLRKVKYFHHMGEHVCWKPYFLPSEPYLISIHNNVRITANVRFITHDMIQPMLRDAGSYPVRLENVFYMGKIEIFDNVMIGANSTILYDVKIGPNAIVAAGSVVVKDVPPGTIVGGNPAKVIGSVEEFAKKRYEQLAFRPHDKRPMEEILNYFWKEQSQA